MHYHCELTQYLYLISFLLHSQAATKWKVIGVMLQVPMGVLDIIEHKHNQEPVNALLEVFTEWQKTRCSPYVWKTILHVFTSDVVARNDIANDIRLTF